MNLEEERLDNQQLRNLSTPQLIRRALDESRMLVKAEVLHARRELEADLRAVKRSAIFFTIGGALVLCGLTLLLVALAWALPLAAPLGALLVGLGLIGGAVVLALLGRKAFPLKPLDETRKRLEREVTHFRKELQ